MQGSIRSSSGDLRAASIFLDDQGRLRPATGLFRRANHSLTVDAEYIDEQLQAALNKEQLDTLDIREVDPERLLEVRLRQVNRESPADDWDDLWTLIRECGSTGAVQTIQRTVRNPLALKAAQLHR